MGTPPPVQGKHTWGAGPPQIAEEVAACKRPQHRRARLMPVTSKPADGSLYSRIFEGGSRNL